jgi:hypothetical protein
VKHLYVNTDAADDTGDGSQGSPKKWLASAVALLPADITADDAYTIHCRGSVADPTNVTVSTVTDATHYVLIQAETGHRASAVWDASKYRLSTTPAANSLVLGAAYARVDGLQIEYVGTGNSRTTVQLSAAGTRDHRISNCHIRRPSSATGTYLVGLSIGDSASNFVRVWNTVIAGFSEANSKAIASGSSSNYGAFYNCTFAGNAMAIGSSSSCLQFKNCLFTGNTTDCASTVAAGTDYNATNNASIGYTVTGGGNIHDRVGQTFTFAGAGDYHLASNDAGARDYGVTDPGSGLFSNDIDGETRSGSWDIGADEYVAASGGGRAHALLMMGVG